MDDFVFFMPCFYVFQSSSLESCEFFKLPNNQYNFALLKNVTGFLKKKLSHFLTFQSPPFFFSSEEMVGILCSAYEQSIKTFNHLSVLSWPKSSFRFFSVSYYGEPQQTFFSPAEFSGKYCLGHTNSETVSVREAWQLAPRVKERL